MKIYNNKSTDTLFQLNSVYDAMPYHTNATIKWQSDAFVFYYRLFRLKI